MSNETDRDPITRLGRLQKHLEQIKSGRGRRRRDSRDPKHVENGLKGILDSQTELLAKELVVDNEE